MYIANNMFFLHYLSSKSYHFVIYICRDFTFCIFIYELKVVFMSFYVLNNIGILNKMCICLIFALRFKTKYSVSSFLSATVETKHMPNIC